MSESLLPRIADEKIEHSIFQFIGSTLNLHDKKTISREMYHLHHYMLIRNATSVPINFAAFLEMIRNRPLHEIISINPRDSIVEEMIKQPLFINDRLSEEANEFFLDYRENKHDIKQSEQEHMRVFLMHCRLQENQNKYQKLYDLVRVKLYNKNFYVNGKFSSEPDVNIMLEKEFKGYIMEVSMDYQLING